MKSIIISTILLLALASCGDTINSTAPSKDDRIIKGVVKGILLDNNTNQPIIGALVNTDPFSSTTRSDTNGKFELLQVGPDLYNLIITHEDYFNFTSNIRVSDQITNEIELRLTSYEYINTAPEKPLLVFPNNESTIGFTSLGLKWNVLDIDKDSLFVDVYFSEKGKPFEKLAEDFIDNSYYFTYNFIEMAQYQWYIVVKDKYRATISDTNIFTYKEIDVTTIPNLKGNWKFNGNASDDGPNFYTSNVENISYVDDRYANNQSSIRFIGRAGVNSKVVLSKVIQLQSEFTISLWLKPDEALGENGSVGYFEFVSKWEGAGVGLASWAFGIQKQSKVYLSTYNNGETTNRLSSSLIQHSEWQHIAVTFDNGKVTFYINGIPDNTATGLQIPQLSELNVTIGGRQDQASSYNGSMDDLYIFDRKLDDSEILQLSQE